MVFYLPYTDVWSLLGFPPRERLSRKHWLLTYIRCNKSLHYTRLIFCPPFCWNRIRCKIKHAIINTDNVLNTTLLCISCGMKSSFSFLVFVCEKVISLYDESLHIRRHYTILVAVVVLTFTKSILNIGACKYKNTLRKLKYINITVYDLYSFKFH